MGAALGGLAMLAVAQPGGASAEVRQVTSASFTVAGSNGYTVNVEGMRGSVRVLASESVPPIATISSAGEVRQPNAGSTSAATYFAHDPDATPGLPYDPTSIEADLGGLGQISVAFEPSSETRVTDLHPKKGCEGPHRLVRRLGTFVGTIRFHGEQGYTTVEKTRARGSIGTTFGGCGPTLVAGPLGPTLRVRTRDSIPNGRVDLWVTGGRRPTFTATATEEVDESLFIAREGRAVGGRSSFLLEDGSLSLDPPAPFSGSALLEHAWEKSSSWSGSLRVAFPGIVTRLTGSAFVPGHLH